MAGPPVWAVGQVLTASDVNQWLLPAMVIKDTDEPITSSTTLQADNQLTLPVAANAKYWVQCYLNYEGGALGSSDLKVQWANPAGSLMRYQCNGIGPGGGYIGMTTRAGADIYAIGTGGAGNTMSALMTGAVTVGANAGNVTLTWAQNTSSGTATVVHATSALYLQRIA